MNAYTIPIRGNTKAKDNLKIFTCNRTQIKPYYESFEERFEGIQSPTEIVTKSLQLPIDEECDIISEIQMLNALKKIIPLNIARAKILNINKYTMDSSHCNNCIHALQCLQACTNPLPKHRTVTKAFIELHHLNLVL